MGELDKLPYDLRIDKYSVLVYQVYKFTHNLYSLKKISDMLIRKVLYLPLYYVFKPVNEKDITQLQSKLKSTQ